MGLEATASESVVDEKEEKHFHHAMGQKLHEVPFQATFRTLGSFRERKARPEERKTEWRKKQRRFREWSSAFHRGNVTGWENIFRRTHGTQS